MMHGYYDGSWGAGDWAAMSVMMLLFWSALIALVVWIVRSLRGESGGDTATKPTADHAQGVLAERFARGEIDDDEFQRRRELLHAGPRS